MQQFFVWKNWPNNYRWPVIVGMITFCTAILFSLYFYVIGQDQMLPWDFEGGLERVSITMDAFRFRFFDWVINADSFVLLEEYSSGMMEWSSEPYFWWMILWFIGISLLLTAVSDFSFYFYLGGVSLTLLSLASMGWNQVGVLTDTHPKLFLALILIVIVGMTYFFRRKSVEISYSIRFISYILVLATFVLISFYWGNTSNVETVLAGQGVLGMLIPIVIFLLISSQSIPGALVYFLIKKNQGHNNFYHVLIIALILILNLMYAQGVAYHRVDWGIIYITPNVLMLVSAIITIWWLKVKDESYEEYIKYEPTGLYAYLGIAISAFAAISLFYATGNNPMIMGIDMTSSSIYLMMSFTFFLYLISNFYVEIEKGLDVTKVLFKPRGLGFWMSWNIGIAGIVLMGFAFDFPQNRLMFSAYNNSLGDVAVINKDESKANTYYQLANVYNAFNWHSNHALATLAVKNGQNYAVEGYLKNAMMGKPLPQSYIMMANYLVKDERIEVAIETLEKGMLFFPDDYRIKNNLAILKARQGDLKDASSILEEMKSQNESNPRLESNLFAIHTLDGKRSEFLESNLPDESNTVAWVNHMAYLNREAILSAYPFDFSKMNAEIVDLPSVAYMYNYAFNKNSEIEDEAYELLDSLSRNDKNVYLKELMQFAKSNVLLSKGQTKEGFQIIDILHGQANEYDTYYPYLKGMMEMKFGAYARAAEHFKDAFYKGNKRSLLAMAIAYTEAGKQKEALNAWQNIQGLFKDEVLSQDAADYIQLLGDEKINISSYKGNNGFLYRLAAIRKDRLSKKDFEAIYQGIDDVDVRVRMAIERSAFLTSKQDMKGAEFWLEKASLEKGISEESNGLMSMAQWNWCIAFDQDRWKDHQKLDQIQYPYLGERFQSYYKAKLYSKEYKLNDTDQEKLLKFACEGLPFNASVCLAYADQLKKGDKFKEAIYYTLYDAYLLNPYNFDLSASYISYCLELGQDNYAKLALDDALLYLKEAEYKKLENIYQLKKIDVKKAHDQWDVE